MGSIEISGFIRLMEKIRGARCVVKVLKITDSIKGCRLFFIIRQLSVNENAWCK